MGKALSAYTLSSFSFWAYDGSVFVSEAKASEKYIYFPESSVKKTDFIHLC